MSYFILPSLSFTEQAAEGLQDPPLCTNLRPRFRCNPLVRETNNARLA